MGGVEVDVAFAAVEVEEVDFAADEAARGLASVLEDDAVAFALPELVLKGADFVGEAVVADRPSDTRRVRPLAVVRGLGIEFVSFAFLSSVVALFEAVVFPGSQFLRRSRTLRWPEGFADADVLALVAFAEVAVEGAEVVVEFEATVVAVVAVVAAVAAVAVVG